MTAADETPLRIGFYSPALPDSGAANGIVTYVSIMRDALRGLGHSVTVVTPDHIEHTDGEVCELPQLTGAIGRIRAIGEFCRRDDGSDPWSRLRTVDAFRAARRAGVQVFEIEESFGWATRLAGRGVAVVERLHGPHVFGREPIESSKQERLGALREAAELASFGSVDAVTCPSRRLLAAIVDHYQLDLPLAAAIPNPIPVSSTDARWRLDRTDLHQILCVGRFDLRKGADLVIQAFTLALNRNPGLKLVMVGPDTGLRQGNGTYVHFDEFIRKAVPPKVRDRIQFLGAQPANVIKQLRLQSLIALVGSRFENFAYSIAETMALGMPVLASDSFGNAEMLRDNVDGRIVPAGNVGAMAEAIVELTTDHEKLARLGRSAHRRVADLLAPGRIASETAAVYRQALARVEAALAS